MKRAQGVISSEGSNVARTEGAPTPFQTTPSARATQPLIRLWRKGNRYARKGVLRSKERYDTA